MSHCIIKKRYREKLIPLGGINHPLASLHLDQYEKMVKTSHQIILCTCPDQETASYLANMLIEKKAAACVNILPGLTSIYPWQNKIETTQEFLLLIKSRSDLYQTVETIIKSNHPYELPEIIAVPVERGLSEYLHWIDACLTVN